jgi:DNA-directed RNA polymerase subunit M/transcription elongation factor TFIIS
MSTIRNQFGRRNLTLASRCKLADELAKALEPKARDNQKLSDGPGKRSVKIDEPIDVRDQAAKEAGVSPKSEPKPRVRAAGDDRYIIVQRPRCRACQSVDLVAYKTSDSGDGSITRYVICRSCFEKWKLVLE